MTPARSGNGSLRDHATVSVRISDLVLRRPVRRGWVLGMLLSCVLLLLLGVSITWLFVEGVGIWGIRIPVAWGFAIVNFVWWIGIGHAGTFISAILFLLHQNWRRPINRFAEAMTLFAVACAGLFPLLHLGRPALFYWLMPYPNTMGLWPQFRSPLIWDFFAIATYATVSLLFWYVGIVPDLATLRDRAQRPWVQRVYGALALGWRGSAQHWQRYQTAYLLLAGLATPLVISVHSIVGLDFAVALVPGWHSTLLPPYFVAGAIFSGLACVLLLAIPLRRAFDLYDFVTARHLDLLAKLMLATGLMVAYAYALDWFMGWYEGEPAELDMLRGHFDGRYAWVYWALIACNVVVPQALWWRRVRYQPVLLALVSLCVLLGMWAERFVIIACSLQRPELPSAWLDYAPTLWDWATLAGSFGLFLLLWFLFLRLLPPISMHEMRGEVSERNRLEGDERSERTARDRATVSAVERIDTEPWGLLARFAGEESLLSASRSLHGAGYRQLDAYSPLPIEGLEQVLGRAHDSIAKVTLLAALCGAAVGFGLQCWSCLLSYPLDVGGKPHFSWPAFLPITFELAVLFGAGAAVIAMLVQNRLPQLYHPVFHAPSFARASSDAFFVGIRAEDPHFDRQATPELLLGLGALEVTEVPT